MASLALIHTVTTLPAMFQPLVKEALPEWHAFNIVDESLLQTTVADGFLAPQTKQRLAGYIFSAAQAGADAIVVTCSTLGEAVNSIRPMSAVPLFRIDQGMADEAVKIATRIGILATLPTTLEPTGTMIRRAAIAACKECTVVEKLCSGAFQLLTGGDKKGHDALVMEGFEELASQVEVVVLAQASMAQALASLKRPGVPYLTSPKLGIAQVARKLRLMHNQT